VHNHRHRNENSQQFTARSGNICNYTVREMAVDDEIRIGIDVEWASPPTDSDMQQFHDHMRNLASKRGDIEEFSTADHDVAQERPERATEPFLESGDAGIPVKPVR
jgi:hypothetical protein